ncbi:MAG: hypothetical protein ACYC3I_00880 [Gemmataceae bacterium]
MCWIEGNATPFGMYAKLFRHRDHFVVIDDVDALYADKSGVRLLKCLCQTETDKGLVWHTDARSLEWQGIPAGIYYQESRPHHRQRLEDAQPECGSIAGPPKLFIASPKRKQGKELPLLALRAGGVLSARPKPRGRATRIPESTASGQRSTWAATRCWVRAQSLGSTLPDSGS